MPITLMKLFQKGMIIQHDKPVYIRGWCEPLDELTLFFDTYEGKTKSDEKGRFEILLPGQPIGGPNSITIESEQSGTYQVEDVWVGEVWLCSGQSNMQLLMSRQIHPLDQAKTYKELATEQIHFYTVPIEPELNHIREDLPGGCWQQATAEVLGECSALAFYLAKKRTKIINGKVGIIIAAQGGTPIDAWLNHREVSEAQYILEQYDKECKAQEAWQTECHNRKKEIDEASWNPIYLPGFFAQTEIGTMCGVVQLQKKIQIPDAVLDSLTEDTPIYLSLGTMVDSDKTYVNGELVGETGYQYPPRFYTVPRSCISSTDVHIDIELCITGGKGRVTPDKPFFLQIGEWKCRLEGEWFYQVVSRMEKPMQELKTLDRYSRALYASMLAPLEGIQTEGVLWYQGESNTTRYEAYEEKLIQLIEQFRELQDNKDLPCYCIQLPEFTIDLEPQEQGWEIIRLAQRRACIKAGATLVSTMGLGDWNDLHPWNKDLIAERVHKAIEERQ